MTPVQAFLVNRLHVLAIQWSDLWTNILSGSVENGWDAVWDQRLGSREMEPHESLGVR